MTLTFLNCRRRSHKYLNILKPVSRCVVRLCRPVNQFPKANGNSIWPSRVAMRCRCNVPRVKSRGSLKTSCLSSALHIMCSTKDATRCFKEFTVDNVVVLFACNIQIHYVIVIWRNTTETFSRFIDFLSEQKKTPSFVPRYTNVQNLEQSYKQNTI